MSLPVPPPIPGTTGPSTRARVLDAAERLVARHGAAHLTLDAVAADAGVSKGGLLYHFRSKEALLAAMVDRYLAGLDERIAGAAARDPGTAANPLLAHVVALLETADTSRAVGAALLAAAADDPELLGRCRERYGRAVEELAALPCGFDGAVLVLLAADGLLLGELLRLTPFTPEQRARAVAAIVRAAVDCGAPRATPDPAALVAHAPAPESVP